MFLWFLLLIKKYLINILNCKRVGTVVISGIAKLLKPHKPN